MPEPLRRGTSTLVIAQAIRDDIQAGRLPHGRQLPSTRDLAMEWRTSVATINRAMDLLAEEGLVLSRARSCRIVHFPQPVDAERSQPQVPLIDDHEATIGFVHEVGHLKNTPRSGWQLAGIRRPESVAEHSFRVGVLAYVIALMEGADASRAAAIALFHDVPEVRTTDLHSVAKPWIEAKADARVIEAQTVALPEALADPIRALIAEFADKQTLEAKCAKDADKLECLLQAREYQAQGNLLVQPWIDSMVTAVNTASGKRLAEAAMRVAPDAWWHGIVAAYGRP